MLDLIPLFKKKFSVFFILNGIVSARKELRQVLQHVHYNCSPASSEDTSVHLQNSATGLEKGENALIFYFSGTSGEQIVPKMQNSLINPNHSCSRVDYFKRKELACESCHDLVGTPPRNCGNKYFGLEMCKLNRGREGMAVGWLLS